MNRASAEASGSVSLVGAGPGDPGLITVAGRERLRRADVVVYDRLAHPALLAEAPAAAERIYVGKTPSEHAVAQEEIGRLLVDRARAGQRVVRLKGGDPFVFGRGGEEALALAAAGVPFRIVPGVTAGIGGLAYAGIPATHRDANSAVTFVSGHAAPEESGLDWEALARGAPALVFYMALRRIGAIAGRLMAHGRPPDEPAVIVSHAATPRQHVIETTLAGLGDAAQQAEPPAVIALGPITALRPRLDWLGRLGKI